MFKKIFYREILNKSCRKFYYDIPKLIECCSHSSLKNKNICSDFTIEVIENKFLLCGFTDGNIIIYDLEALLYDKSAKKFDFYDSHVDRTKKAIKCIQWYPVDSGMYFTCGTEKYINIWDANRGKCVESISLLYNTSWISLSPCCKSMNLVAVACDRNRSILIDIISGSSTHVLTNNSTEHMRTIQWSNREEYILATADQGGHVSIWDVRSPRKAVFHLDQYQNSYANNSNCQAHGGDIRGLEFSPDGLLLATIGNEGRINIWNLLSQTGKLLDLNFGKIFESETVTRNIRFCWTGYSNYKKLWVPSHLDICRLDLEDGSLGRFPSLHFDQITSCIWNRALYQIYTTSLDANILNWKPVLYQ